MKILETIANRIRYITTKEEERGQYSSGYWPSKVREEALRLCSDLEDNLLEVGCGEGLFLTALANKNQSFPAQAGSRLWGGKILGIDNSQHMILKAQERLKKLSISNINLSICDSNKMPFMDESFDIAVCINTLFNLVSFNEVSCVIKELSRVVKEGGKIIFDIRNILNPLVFIKYKFAKYYDSTLKVPVNAYRLNKFEDILKVSNLIIEKKIPIGASNYILAPIVLIQARK